MPALNPTGLPVRVGSITLRTPGLAGDAHAHVPGSPGMRAAEQSTPALEDALAHEQVEPQETIEIDATIEIDIPTALARSTSHEEPAIELTVPEPAPDWGQFLLYTDEAGVTTWNFARDQTNAIDISRGRGGERTYLIPRRVPPSPAAPATRGLIGAVGKKVLKVLAFPLIDPIIGAVTDYFAERWEERRRPYRVRMFTPIDYAAPNARLVGADDWYSIAAGRGLLMVHGTLSRAHTAFGSLAADVVSELHRRYAGRVFAFDHFTLSHAPRRNVEELLQRIPAGTHLELDIVCHSRGGLVSRVIAERLSELGAARDITVRRVVFVAVPNSGTVLANTEYMNDFIDSYTTMLNFFPDNGAVELLEGIITVAKHLAVGAVRGLDGLQSMAPGGSFLSELNSGSKGSAQYFALSADFEPIGGLRAWAIDRLLDRIFRMPNDLVVPTTGVYEANGSSCFPITDRLELGGSSAVVHTQFFGRPEVQRQILDWLA